MILKTPGPAFRGARRFAVGALVALLLAGCIENIDGGGDPDDEVSLDEALPMSMVKAVDADQVADGGTLRIGISSFPATFNPVHADGVASTAPQILAPTLGTAVRVGDDGQWTVDKDYATSVEVIELRPLSVRVELNRNAVWQGGTPITSADMVAYVDAMQDDQYAAAAPPVFDDIERVVPDGDFAYVVEYDDPNADWPAAVYPTLPKAFTKSATMFNEGLTAKAPSANGPFLVSSIERATGTITLHRNPRWWGEQSKLDEIVWRVGEDSVTAAAFKANELEATAVTPTNLAELKDQDLRASRGSEWSQLTLNGGTGPLADADVRRAVMLAVDREAIVDATSARQGARADLMDSVLLLPGQAGSRTGQVPGRDPFAAVKLLEEAGWVRADDGTGPAMREGEQLTLDLPVPDTRTGAVERAEAIAGDLADIGIKVNVTQVPGDTYFDDVVIPLDFDLATFAWQVAPFDISDVKRLFTPIDSPLNFTGKASQAITVAFNQAIKELDHALLPERLAKVDEVARAQASILPLAVIPNVMAIDPKVVNYGPTALADLDWTIVGFKAEQDD